MSTVDILGVPVAAINLAEAADRIEAWVREETGRYAGLRMNPHAFSRIQAQNGSSRRLGLKRKAVYVTVTGVHGIMESVYDPEVRRAHTQAGMCVPDGMPTVWIGRLTGHRRMGRVYGPDLMLELMARSPAAGHRHFFFGGKEGVAERLRERMEDRFPGLNVVGTYSPPFRPMTPEEEAEFAAELERLAPDILWVGLSTPKQERWMAAHVGRINAKVLIGVGAAFDIHAGLLRQAPRWMQRSGLEWFFRLCVEPRRLWRRYLVNNPLFILLMLGQWAGFRVRGSVQDDGERVGHVG